MGLNLHKVLSHCGNGHARGRPRGSGKESRLRGVVGG